MRFPAGRFPAGRFPAGRFPAGRFPAGEFPAGRFPGKRFRRGFPRQLVDTRALGHSSAYERRGPDGPPFRYRQTPFPAPRSGAIQ